MATTTDGVLAASGILRSPFPPEHVGKLPRVTCPNCSDKRRQCDDHTKAHCQVCGSYVSTRHIHLDYVGHADVTSRLLDADPEWSWQPKAVDIDKDVLAAALASGNADLVRMVLASAPPKFDTDERGDPVGLWILLTVGGVTRPGYGSCPSGQGDAVKVLIGDALRNAAMRFGVAVDLWAKGDRADPSAENATAAAGHAVRGRQQQRPDNGNGSRTVRPESRPAQPARQPSPDEIDQDAQAFADEAHEATSLAALKDIHRRAVDARKLAALVRNPATGGVGGYGQYENWRRRQIEEAESALDDLKDAADNAGFPAANLDAHVQKVTGASIQNATAAQLRQAQEAIPQGANA